MAGRPPKPLAADAPPQAARIGAEVRQRRLAQGLTLAELGLRAGYSPQHISSLEQATGSVTRQCLAAIDAALDAYGALLEHLPALVCERALANHARAAARRYDEDVDPVNRRGLLRLAEVGLRTPRARAHTRALCAVRATHAHAPVGEAQSAVRSIAEAETLLAQDSPPLPPPGPGMSELLVCRWEARCWAELEPARGVALYDDIMRDWPRGWTRDGGLYLAYLALACAGAGELDRARAEGRKALAIVRQTQSATAARELQQLGAALSAN